MAIRTLAAYRTALRHLGERNPPHKANIDFCLEQIESILEADNQAYIAALAQKVPVQADPNRLNVQLENALPPEMRFWAELHRGMDAGPNNRRGLEEVAMMVFNSARASGLLPNIIAHQAIRELLNQI